MEYVLIFFSILIALIGFAGCILPGLPGPPLNYLALWLLQWSIKPFTPTFLITWAVIVIIIVVLDYYLPIWTAKKFGATRQGIIGSIVGMFLGMFFTPIGMMGGLIAGAIIGDVIAGRSRGEAVKSGLATFFGTLITIGIKMIASGIMCFYVFYEVGEHYF